MKKTILKNLKYVLIGVSIYIAILLIEIGIIYAVKGEETWDYLKEVWSWYKTLFLVSA